MISWESILIYEDSINNIEKQHKAIFGVVKDREVVRKLALLTSNNIQESNGKGVSNLFFIGFFISISKQNGLGRYTEQCKLDYIEYAPYVNQMLQVNDLKYSINERLREGLGIFNELAGLEKFMSSMYPRTANVAKPSIL
jgi:hypothetical protein